MAEINRIIVEYHLLDDNTGKGIINKKKREKRQTRTLGTDKTKQKDTGKGMIYDNKLTLKNDDSTQL